MLSGLDIANALEMTADQMRLWRWLSRQRRATLAQMVDFVAQPPDEVEVLVESLIDQGSVEATVEAGEIIYRVRLAAKTGWDVPEIVQRSLLPGSPLAVIPNPTGLAQIVAGESLELRVTVSNKGAQPALIDVYLTDLDDTHSVVAWCPVHHERLALGPQQSSEVRFIIPVPIQALPGTYPYRIVVDAPDHYPADTPIRCDQGLQVLTPVTETSRMVDPTFTVTPATSSTQALPVLPGAAVELTVLVYNRGDRVDRFRLTCPDLDLSWYRVRYPEGLALPGLVTETDGLPLNPGAKGEITLLLQPPLNTPAGDYFPTLSLHSANTPDLMLLDVVYLQVLPVPTLTLQWLPVQDVIGQGYHRGEYLLELVNQGNARRTVQVALGHTQPRPPYRHRLSTETVTIAPGATEHVGLLVVPNPAWRRPWFGAGRLITFEVLLQDIDRLPLSPTLYQGTLRWLPRPWWQGLLLILTGLGLLGTLLLALWLLLLRPPAPPQVADLRASEATYSAATGDPIRLSWRIRHTKGLDELQLVGRSTDGTVLSPLVSYDLRNGIPPELAAVCRQARRDLLCNGVTTDARLPGDYVFELSARRQGNVASSQTTDVIQLLPVDLPRVTELATRDLTYPDARRQGRGTLVPVSWTVTHPEQLQNLTLIGRRDDGSISSNPQTWDFSTWNVGEDIPDALAQYCKVDTVLTCTDVMVRVEKAGTTVFELTARPRVATDEDPDSRQSEPIAITPIAPEITSLKVNGVEAGPGYIVEFDRSNPRREIAIAWEVLAEPGTKVELLPAPGPVALKGSVNYPLSQQSGRDTVTLQVTPETGPPVTRSFNLEVFDASLGELPLNPTAVPLPPLPIPGAFPAGIPAMPPSPLPPGGPGSGAIPGGAPGSGQRSEDLLTPTELPPQFD